MTRDVYIAGIGMTPFGRHLGKSHDDLTRAAVLDALRDSGLPPQRLQLSVYANVIQGFFSGEMSIPGEYALRPLGIEGVTALNVEAACASSTIALHVACNYIRAGIVDAAVVVGVEKLYTEDREKKFAVFRQERDIMEAFRYLDRTKALLAPAPEGVETPSKNIMMDAYAAQARLHMATYGTTQEQIAAVAAKNHGHSQFNTLSQYQNAMTVEEVLSAPCVAWPLTNPMCAPISDGAAAAILCAGDLLKSIPRRKSVQIKAAYSMTGSEREPERYEDHVTRKAATRIFDMAGIGPGDIDVAEVHDASSSGEIIQTEALGFCLPGRGGPDALRGQTKLGGRIPVNVSGGLVSKGHPLGATGLGQVFELVTQLRGEAGKRQVTGARLALAENSGGFYGVEDGMSAITVLEAIS